MGRESVGQRFTAALDGLIDQVKGDRTILAAMLCGSLSHDIVWERSDIDLVLITIDDKIADPGGLALYADGVNVHAVLLTRTEFRTTVEGAPRNSFMHSFLAKGRLLYTHDPTIADLCGRLQDIGARDTSVQLLRAATGALAAVYKAHKWFLTRGDLEYTALWILYAATPLAQVEVFGRRLLADREVIPQAAALNPGFFNTIYTDLLNGQKTAPRVAAALEAVDVYLATRARTVFQPVFDYLRDAGEPRSCRDIEHHFTRHFDIGGVVGACEYLADQGLIEKASLPARLTKKSRIQVQELAFFSPEPPDGR